MFASTVTTGSVTQAAIQHPGGPPCVGGGMFSQVKSWWRGASLPPCVVYVLCMCMCCGVYMWWVMHPKLDANLCNNAMCYFLNSCRNSSARPILSFINRIPRTSAST